MRPARRVKLSGHPPGGAGVLIVGASARAAAFSALRAGLTPECADLFGDADLRARCPVWRVEPNDYPRGFLDVPALQESGPWLYTGGLENRPELIEELARRRQPLWGNAAPVLRRVRCPFAVCDVLRGAGLPCPAVRRSDDAPYGGRWLAKPLAGAGGSGIRVGGPARRPFYWQEFIEGESCAALYVGDGQTARLLGVTRQLVGESWLHAAPFHYCGSVGPLGLGPGLCQAFTDLGAALGGGFGLMGLFGVDCVVRDGAPYPVEVNPRYTASVEVIEHATGLPALVLHRQAFAASGGCEPPGEDNRGVHTPRSPVVGKAILFARASLSFPDDGRWFDPAADPDTLPVFADVPHGGDLIEAGRPILTLFARAATAGDCLGRLRDVAAGLDRRLFGP